MYFFFLTYVNKFIASLINSFEDIYFLITRFINKWNPRRSVWRSWRELRRGFSLQFFIALETHIVLKNCCARTKTFMFFFWIIEHKTDTEMDFKLYWEMHLLYIIYYLFGKQNVNNNNKVNKFYSQDYK